LVAGSLSALAFFGCVLLHELSHCIVARRLGIRVRIDQSWFIAFILFSWTLSAVYFPFQVPDYPKYTYWLAGSLSALAFFGCVLLHELTHCIVARRLGIPVRRITLFIFGGVSEMEQM